MKTFVWCPQEAIKKCLSIWEVPHSHICIRSVGAEITTPQCGNPALYLDFHDLDPEAIRRTVHYAENPVEGEAFIKGCLTDEQAHAMAEFAHYRPDDELIVVNCEAGISRSPGSVLAFRRFYGGDVDEPYKKAIPNMHVASVVGRVLREYKPVP